jgi:hypothetical protein
VELRAPARAQFDDGTLSIISPGKKLCENLGHSRLTEVLLGLAVLTPISASAEKLPICTQLATATNADITETASDNQGIASPQAAIVPATLTNAAYYLVQFQYLFKSFIGQWAVIQGTNSAASSGREEGKLRNAKLNVLKRRTPCK